jgi:hypothetical protein
VFLFFSCLDAIAFSMVAEDLVEKDFKKKDLVEMNVYLATQNMKVDALNHIATLDTKNKSFPHWNKFKCVSNFAIKYVLKKCYNVNPSKCTASLNGQKVLHFNCIIKKLPN